MVCLKGVLKNVSIVGVLDKLPFKDRTMTAVAVGSSMALTIQRAEGLDLRTRTVHIDRSKANLWQALSKGRNASFTVDDRSGNIAQGHEVLTDINANLKS